MIRLAKGRHSPVLTILYALFLAVSAAQADAQDAGRRREELARVVDKINDPDPLMRIANLEEIISRGDATEIQIAVKTALARDDPELKSIALRGYASNLHDLYLDLRLHKDLEIKLAGADPNDRYIQHVIQRLNELSRLTSGRLHIRIEKMDAKSGKFIAYGMNRVHELIDIRRGDGQIVGGHMRMNVGIDYPSQHRCSIDLSPTPSLTLEGTITCDDMPLVLLSMPMY